MIKRIILLSILFFTILSATGLSTKGQYAKGEKVFIAFKDMKELNQDWIGIYHQGSTNAWSNVVKWAWTNDVTDGEVTIKGLVPGKYEARAFYNNSFSLEATTKFEVVEVNDNLNIKELTPIYRNNKLLLIHIHKILGDKEIKSNPKDWVGLYKKSDSNDWSNVIKWTWVKDFTPVHLDGLRFSFGTVDLASGEYEFRYFLNNSFKTFKSKSFTYKKYDPGLKQISSYYESKSKKVKISLRGRVFDTLSELPIANPEDWVGIYKKSASNAWSNVLGWAFVRDFEEDFKCQAFDKYGTCVGRRPSSLDYTVNNLKLNRNEKYEVRYFLNNSFITYKSEDITFQ